MIYSHPSRQKIRWLRAWMSPNYDVMTGQQVTPDPAVDGGWTWVEQFTTANGKLVSDCRVLLQEVSTTKVVIPTGQTIVTDQSCLSMSDEIPLGMMDKIIPQGNHRGEVRRVEYKETITSSGTGTDILTVFPVFDIVGIMAVDGTLYPSVDYAVSSDLTGVTWLFGAPAEGVHYSIIYHFYPTYSVITDLGQPGPFNQGLEMPQSVVLQYQQPETFRR
jgi:hypothetical protein